ncbi:MAG: class I SAM-dependent methyltransferase [Planctomycetes bacterium]|nr:class I SAM-dependent methyltransferase [Planctomycetota bacterium]MCB9887552.1 class I SAM-dependent methyltransferase [Planctomycetota bacterium]
MDSPELPHPTDNRWLAPLVGLFRSVRFRVREVLAAPTQWRRHKRRVDRAFDAAHGVDTGGVVPLHAMGVTTPSARLAVDYIASDPEEFEAAMTALAVDAERFTFVDVGCGKGRALILAARQPWRRLIGVEFSSSLCAVARTNLARAVGGARQVEVRCQDALEFELPDEPLVLFLYNPFERSLMKAFAARVAASLERSPRDIRVVYTNPFHGDEWIAAGFELCARGDTHAIYRSVARR